jgi:broad specificity phosphatase PhoE
MTCLLMARHGQTDWNLQGRYQGQADPPLNKNGLAQAKALATQFATNSIDAVYSSDLKRALDTARIIAARLKLDARVDRRLREIGLGEWEGMYFDDILEKYPEEWRMREIDPLNARAPGGETLAELAERVWSFADETSRLYPKATLLVISHGLAIAALLCRARTIPIQEAYLNIPENAEIIDILWPPV